MRRLMEEKGEENLIGKLMKWYSGWFGCVKEGVRVFCCLSMKEARRGEARREGDAKERQITNRELQSK
jgi:hypothetical protein